MKKVELPIVYEKATGDWLNLCGIKYDNGNIVSVEAWNGNEVVTYEKEKFKIESDVAELHQKNCCNLKNLKVGLNNFKENCKNLNNASMDILLENYKNISVLIGKSMDQYSLEIAYPAQNLLEDLRIEIERRIQHRC